MSYAYKALTLATEIFAAAGTNSFDPDGEGVVWDSIGFTKALEIDGGMKYFYENQVVFGRVVKKDAHVLSRDMKMKFEAANVSATGMRLALNMADTGDGLNDRTDATKLWLKFVQTDAKGVVRGTYRAFFHLELDGSFTAQAEDQAMQKFVATLLHAEKNDATITLS